jgi:predicted aspartyl protease
MLRMTSLTVALLLCRFGTSAADMSVSEAPRELPPLFAAATRTDKVGRILAPVMINGRGPFNLLVDTGANSTTFSTTLADQLGIDYRGSVAKVVLNGVTGRALVPVVSVDRLEAGALILRDQQVPIVEPRVMAEADGILGIAALTDKQLTVDFRNNRVSLGYSQRLPTYMATVKARRLPAGLLVTPALVGRVRAVAIIDTGAERTLGNRALQEALKSQHGLPTAVSVQGATSEIAEGTQVLIQNIKLGDIRVNNSQVAFGDFHVFDIWDLNDQPALILGMDVIGRVDVFVIDFRRLEIGFRS